MDIATRGGMRECCARSWKGEEVVGEESPADLDWTASVDIVGCNDFPGAASGYARLGNELIDQVVDAT